MRKKSEKSRRKDIEKDLRDRLSKRGNVGKHFEDMIDSYMADWDFEKKLIEDIQFRGVTVSYNNGGGQTGMKTNDSIGMLLKVQDRMAKTLDKLGLKPEEIKPEEEDEL